MNDIKNKIENFKKMLTQWEYEYYVLNKPSVDDTVYDLTLKELNVLENNNPEYITSDSPTQRVGGTPILNFKKFTHLIPMLSLSNAFNNEELYKFDKDIQKAINKFTDIDYCVEPKIDGLSVALHYDSNNLILGVSRGDGKNGDDITSNIKTVRSIPLKIKENKKIEIRGEVFLTKKEFIKINQQFTNDEDKFSNCRNAASGALHNLDPKEASKRNLTMDCYYVSNPLDYNLKSQIEVLNYLSSNGFKVCKDTKLCHGIKEVIQQIQYLSNNRTNFEYPLDGVVIKVNELNLHSKIGYTSKFPKWAIAYKFPATIVETKLLDIITTVGRTGRINYVAKLKPVELDGSIVQYSTLHNAEYIATKDIRINDYVNIFKAGDIIPKVIEPVLSKRKDTKVFLPIEFCPICKSKLEKNDGEVDQYCINNNCQARIINSLIHFCSRNAMNIDGLSEKIIQKLYEKKFIREIVDIYSLKDNFDQIIKSDLRIKNKTMNNLINAIEKSKTQNFDKLIFGLGIRHVGEISAKVLANHFKNIDNLINASIEQLMEVEDIGLTVAESIYDYFKNEYNIILINKIKEIGLITHIKENTQINQNSQYYKKTFVITGAFDLPRNIIKERLQFLYDAKVSNSVGPSVDYLIANDTTSTKYKQAVKMNVKILTERIW